MRNIKEEGHYTIKLVDKLPIKGNYNWLYAIKSDRITEFHKMKLKDNSWETIQIGSAGNGGNSVFIEEGQNITLTGDGSEDNPFIINSEQDNKNKHLDFYLNTSTLSKSAIATAINNSPLFTISETETLFVSVYGSITQDNQTFPLKKVCVLKDKGKGTYGTGGTNTLINTDIIFVSSLEVAAPTDIANIPSTQTIELGDVGSDDIVTAFNGHTFTGSEDPVQGQEEGYVLINVTIDSEDLQYLFVGVGGDYGVGGTETAVLEDFILLTGNLSFGGIQNLQQVTDIGSDTTNTIIVNKTGTSGTGFIVNQEDGASAALGFTALGPDNQGALTLKNNSGIASSLSMPHAATQPAFYNFPLVNFGNYTLPISVNGVLASSNGNITVPVGDSDQDLQSVLDIGNLALSPNSESRVEFNLANVSPDIKLYTETTSNKRYGKLTIFPGFINATASTSIGSENEISLKPIPTIKHAENGFVSTLNFQTPTVSNTIKFPAPATTGTRYLSLSVNGIEADSTGDIDISSLLGDYISLSGTEVGSPVTGDIEVNELSRNFWIAGANAPDDYYAITFGESGISTYYLDTNTNETSSLTVTSGEIHVGNDDGLGGIGIHKGLSSDKYYGANYDDNTYIQKQYVNPLFPISTADTGTVISLTTSGGNLCNMASANSNTSFTTTGTVLNAYAKVLINTTSEPTVNGNPPTSGATWVTGTDMYMLIDYNGVNVEYRLMEI